MWNGVDTWFWCICGPWRKSGQETCPSRTMRVAIPELLQRHSGTVVSAFERVLSLANAVSQFDAGDGGRCTGKRLNLGHGRAPSLDGPVILFDHVVQVLVRADEHVTPARVLAAQAPQLAAAWPVAIQCDLSWKAWQRGCQ